MRLCPPPGTPCSDISPQASCPDCDALSQHEDPRHQQFCPSQVPEDAQAGPAGGLEKPQVGGGVRRGRGHGPPLSLAVTAQEGAPRCQRGRAPGFPPQARPVPGVVLPEGRPSGMQARVHLPHRALRACGEAVGGSAGQQPRQERKAVLRSAAGGPGPRSRFQEGERERTPSRRPDEGRDEKEARGECGGGRKAPQNRQRPLLLRAGALWDGRRPRRQPSAGPPDFPRARGAHALPDRDPFPPPEGGPSPGGGSGAPVLALRPSRGRTHRRRPAAHAGHQVCPTRGGADRDSGL